MPVVRDGRGQRSEFAVGLVGAPPGPIERRRATEAELEGFAPGRPSIGLPRSAKPPPVRATPQRMQASRLRGSARRIEVLAAARAAADPEPEPPARPLEEPVMTDHVYAHADNLLAVHEASLEAITAFNQLEQATTGLNAARTRWDVAQQALQAAIDAYGGHQAPAPPDPGDPEPSEAEQRHERLLNGDGVAVAVERAKDPLAPWQRRMLDALLAADGDRGAAADELGIKRDSLVGSLSSLRKLLRTEHLTEAERAVLARRR